MSKRIRIVLEKTTRTDLICIACGVFRTEYAIASAHGEAQAGVHTRCLGALGKRAPREREEAPAPTREHRPPAVQVINGAIVLDHGNGRRSITLPKAAEHVTILERDPTREVEEAFKKFDNEVAKIEEKVAGLAPGPSWDSLT